MTPPVTVQSPTSLYVATPSIEPGWADPANAIGAPAAVANLGLPSPQLVSDGAPGTYSMNYRNESVLARVSPPPTDDKLLKKIDLAYVFNSLTDRNEPALNVQPVPGAPIDPGKPDGFKFPPPVAPLLKLGDHEPHVPGVNEPGDPYTPLMRAYAGDTVHVRTLVGADLLAHTFQIQGVGWDFEPDDASSGRKNAQAMGISEHFEMQFKLPSFAANHAYPLPPFADYLVAPSSSVSGLGNGDWTLMRAFVNESGRTGTKSYLSPLPNNAINHVEAKRRHMAAKVRDITARFAPLKARGTDQVRGNLRYINVTATTVTQALPEQALNFNSRAPQNLGFQLNNILLFVRTADLNDKGQLKPGAPREPLILRARAGDWIMVNLINDLPVGATTDPALTSKPNLGKSNYPGNQVVLTSRQAGLHPALVSYDITDANGVNLGFNPEVTVDPGKSRTFLWYAGDLTAHEHGVHERPVEFGATNLVPADLMVQPQFGMVGADHRAGGLRVVRGHRDPRVGHGDHPGQGSLPGVRARRPERRGQRELGGVQLPDRAVHGPAAPSQGRHPRVRHGLLEPAAQPPRRPADPGLPGGCRHPGPVPVRDAQHHHVVADAVRVRHPRSRLAGGALLRGREEDRPQPPVAVLRGPAGRPVRGVQLRPRPRRRPVRRAGRLPL